MYRVCPHPFCDQFEIKEQDDALVIRRIDAYSGWWFDLNLTSPQGEIINVGKSPEPVKIISLVKSFKILVCISFYYSEDGLKHLKKVLNNIDTYEHPCYVVIDTNSQSTNDVLSSLYPEVEIIVHQNLEHPHHLSGKHREYIRDHVDEYDFVIYTEGDILIPFTCILDFLDKIEKMWPTYIPAYRRLEWNGREYHAGDVRYPEKITEGELVHIEDRYGKRRAYYQSGIPYQGFWMLPTKFLKPYVDPHFVYLSQDRELLASFPHGPPPNFTPVKNNRNPRFLNKIPLYEVENDSLSMRCYVYHLSDKHTEVYPVPIRNLLVFYRDKNTSTDSQQDNTTDEILKKADTTVEIQTVQSCRDENDTVD